MTDITAGRAECAREEQHRQRLALHQKVLVVLGAAVGLVCGVGTVFAGLVGICMKPMAASLNWSRADVTLLTIVIALGTALGAPCLGYFADRIGWSRVIAISIVTLCAGLLAVSVAPPSYLYMIAVGLVTAYGPPMVLPDTSASFLSLSMATGNGHGLRCSAVAWARSAFPSSPTSCRGHDWRQFLPVLVRSRCFWVLPGTNSSSAYWLDSGSNAGSSASEGEANESCG